MRDLSDELDVSAGPFMDTAAVMKNLDLVVTSDTATAHLAVRWWGYRFGLRYPRCPIGGGWSIGRTALGIPRCVCFGKAGEWSDVFLANCR